jgi:hypothetical protein
LLNFRPHSKILKKHNGHWHKINITEQVSPLLILSNKNFTAT